MVKVEFIDKPYVREDGVQVMFAFKYGLKLVDCETGKELFYLRKDDRNYKNEYLNDERRKEFPYNNIPVHRTIKGLTLYNVTNQILDYNKIYKLMRYGKDYINCIDAENLSIIEKCAYDKVLYSEDSYLSVIQDDETNYEKAYMVISSQEVPELKMTPEELRNLILLKKIKLKNAKTPYISLLLNKGVSKDDIDKAKKLLIKR